MAVPFIQTSLSRGEIAPSLFGHVDLAYFHTAASTMRNMYAGYRGGGYSRAGTAFVGLSKQNPALGQAKPRLIAFNFNINQEFPLEFGDFYFRILANGGYVTEAAFSITGASNSSPCVVAAPGHNFADGDWVTISGVLGPTILNSQTFIVTGAVAGVSIALETTDFAAFSTLGQPAYAGGGQIARIYTVATPYAAADLPLLKWAQSADTMSLTHPNYPPQELKRFGPTNWTIAPASFAATIAAPASASGSATTHPDSGTSPPTLPTAYAYQVTAIDPKTGQESEASPTVNITDSVDIAATAGSIVIDWTPVAGAEFYNIYRAPASYNTDPGNTTNALPVPAGALFGFVGQSLGTQFVDSNIVADTVLSPPQHKNPFAPGAIQAVQMTASSADWTSATVTISTATGSGFVGQCVIVNSAIAAVIIVDAGQNYAPGDSAVFTGDGSSASATLVVGPATGTYPGLASYFQQRRVYAASLNNPDTYWMSQPGAFLNFDSAIPVNDSDAITGTPWSEQVDGIQWMVQMPLGLVTFTGGGVWQVGAANSVVFAPSAITPSNQIAASQSSIGASATVPPIKINWNLLYPEAKGYTIRELTYQLYFNIYTGQDISWPSSHLLVGHTIAEWAWAEEPYKLLWLARDDGILLSLTYMKEQEVAGFARHDTQGQVRSLCSVTELPVDALYLVVERPVAAGGTRFFVERMDNRLWNSVEDVWAVDCGLTLPLGHPAATLFASAASGDNVVLTTAPAAFNPEQINGILRSGGGIALLTGYIGPNQVTANWLYPCQQVTPNDPDQTPLPQPPGSWSIAGPQTSVRAPHLAGKIVTGIADGIPIPPRRAAADGTVTLDRAASRITIGLGFTAQLQSVYLDTGQPTVQGRRKAISAATVRVEATSFVQLGANQVDASTLSPAPLFATWNLPPPVLSTDAPKTYQTASGGAVQPLFTGDLRALIPSAWQKPGQVAVQQNLPLPLNVLALIPELLPGDMPEAALSQRAAPPGGPSGGQPTRRTA